VSLCFKNRITTELANLIASHNRNLGGTEEGRMWCLKALHPADPTVSGVGIPDQSSLPTVMMNFKSTYQIATTATTGLWSFTFQGLPHPIGFGAAVINSNTQSNVAAEFLNTQVDGTTHAAKVAAWVNDFKAWRLTYYSVTMICDAPMIANQGTIVCCNAPVRLVKHVAESNVSITDIDLGQGIPTVYTMKSSDMPDFNDAQTMPNAYMGKSVDGIYCPMPLTPSSQKWMSYGDYMYMGSDLNNVQGGSVYLDEGILIPWCISGPRRKGMPKEMKYAPKISQFEEKKSSDKDSPIKYNHGAGGTYPFLSLMPIMCDDDENSYWYGGFIGDLTVKMCNGTWVNIAAQGLAPTTSYTVVVRAGFECQVAPGTMYTPQQRISPLFDPLALESYAIIRSSLKDAYPASYNDLGKLWTLIKEAANVVAPILMGIPNPIAKGIGVAIPAATGLVDVIKNVVSSGRQKNSARAVDNAKAIVASQLAPERTILQPRPRNVNKQRRSKQKKSKRAPKTVTVPVDVVTLPK